MEKNHFRYCFIAAAITGATVVGAPFSFAQDTPETGKSNRRLNLEEVVVTAQKREENLQEIPLSVTAYTSDQLDALGVTNPKDLVAITPGLNYDEIANYSIIFIRGIGTDVFVPSGDPSVASYVDGVYFPFSHGLARELDVVERIEVLKGPQGTLFGRNTTGGAIHIITKDPAPEPEASFQVSYGSYNDIRTRAFFTGPLTETLSGSLGFVVNSRDEYYELSDQSPQNDLQDYAEKGLRLKLRYEPTEWFEMLASSFVFQSEGPGTHLFESLECSPPGQALGCDPTEEHYKYDGDVQPFSYAEAYVSSLVMEFHPDWFDIKSITAYQEFVDDSQVDFDGTEQAMVSFNASDQIARVFTQEIQLISNEDGVGSSLFGQPFNWIGGYYYIKSLAGFQDLDLQALGGDEAFAPGGAAESLAFIGDLYTSLTGNAFPVGGFARIDGLLFTEADAWFAQATWAPMDWLGVTVGGRYQEEDRYLDNDRISLVTADNTETVLIDRPPSNSTLRNTNFSPKLTFDFKFGDAGLAYITYSVGFKSGTFNIINVLPGEEIEQEELTNYEIGYKNDFFDGKVRLSAAVFDNTVDNLQAMVVSVQSGGAVRFENAGQLSSSGADFELMWTITPDLFLNMGAAYLNGEYTDYDEASGYDDTTGLFSEGSLDFTGNTAVRTPEWSGNLGLLYTFDVPGGVVEAGGDVYYNSGFWFDAQNTIEQEEYYQTNARISYLYEKYQLRITAFGQNLNDAERYYVKFRTDFGVSGKLASPSSYGIRVNWDY